MDNPFEHLMNKPTKIVKKDGFHKVGYLRGYDGKFLSIEFYTGETIAISVDEIKEVIPHVKKEGFDKGDIDGD